MSGLYGAPGPAATPPAAPVAGATFSRRNLGRIAAAAGRPPSPAAWSAGRRPPWG